jgi:hypothetical protein
MRSISLVRHVLICSKWLICEDQAWILGILMRDSDMVNEDYEELADSGIGLQTIRNSLPGMD